MAGGSGSGTVGGEAEKIGGGLAGAGLLTGGTVGGVAATKSGCLGFFFGSMDSGSYPCFAISVDAKCWVFLNAC